MNGAGRWFRTQCLLCHFPDGIDSMPHGPFCPFFTPPPFPAIIEDVLVHYDGDGKKYKTTVHTYPANDQMHLVNEDVLMQGMTAEQKEAFKKAWGNLK